MKTYLGLILGCVVSVGVAAAQPVAHTQGPAVSFRFVEVGAQRGIQPFAPAPGMANGIAAADYDNDGDIDLFVATAEGTPHHLYRNRGNGFFDDVALASGIDTLQQARAGLWIDLDADLLLDLVLFGDCFNSSDPDCANRDTILVYRQVQPGIFVEATAEVGFGEDRVTNSTSHRGGVAAGDLNGDGWLDLVIGIWGGEARVMLSQRDGTLKEHSSQSKIGGFLNWHWQPLIHDFDGDGDQDVFWAIDFGPNNLWINKGNATFSDIAPMAGIDLAWNDMGAALGDFDNDGDMDIGVTEIEDVGLDRRGVLFRNESVDGVLAFDEIGRPAGVGGIGWGWGTTFCDLDLDGLLDLVVTNGMVNAPPYDTDPSKCFLNVGPGKELRFADVSSEVGFNDTFIASGLVAFDMDRDGDLDLVQATSNGGLRLLENRRVGHGARGHWITIRPRMDGPNARAIGAVVSVRVGDVTRTRVISAGTSILCQEPAEAHFGIGPALVVDEIRVRWPDRSESVYRNVAADRVVEVR